MANFTDSLSSFLWERIASIGRCDDCQGKDIVEGLEASDKQAYQAVMDYMNDISERVYKQGLKDGLAMARELGVTAGE